MNILDPQEIRYRLLKLLAEESGLTQRQMAVKMGISAGKVNYCLSELAGKGLIRIQRFRRSKRKLAYLYVLTPRGLEERGSVTVRFLKRKIEEYDAIKWQIKELREDAERLEGLEEGIGGLMELTRGIV